MRYEGNEEDGWHDENHGREAGGGDWKNGGKAEETIYFFYGERPAPKVEPYLLQQIL